MIAVVSEAWLLEGAAHADAYRSITEAFTRLHRRQPGYRGRRLLFGVDDPCHVINVRFFERVEDYEELIVMDGYSDHIDALSAHLDLSRPPRKEYLSVAGSDDVAAADGGNG